VANGSWEKVEGEKSRMHWFNRTGAGKLEPGKVASSLTSPFFQLKRELGGEGNHIREKKSSDGGPASRRGDLQKGT